MDQTRPFPLNAWYVAAWSHEVGRREPLARTICNKRMVLWRKSDGTIAALEDACWHRRLPLSMGWLEDDDIVCRYHGLAFDGKGQCTRMPSQDKTNPVARVGTYPVLERFASCGCGPAILRSRIRLWCRTCTGTTIPNGPAMEKRCSRNRKTLSTRHREILLPESVQPKNARPIRSESRALLVASIARGRRWLDELITDPAATTESIAGREGCTTRKINMTISLAFLAPDLVKAAIDGRLPHGMGVARLADLSAEWSRQRQMLGLPVL
jgi:nitrite reductase/ring-hydroxylating ferredoxin subunit